MSFTGNNQATSDYDETLPWFDYDPSQSPDLVPRNATHLRIGFSGIPAATDSEAPSIPETAFFRRSQLKFILINPAVLAKIVTGSFSKCGVEVLQFLPASRDSNGRDASAVSHFVSIQSCAFFACTSLHSVLGLEHVALSMQHIGEGAFCLCKNLKKFDFAQLHNLNRLECVAFYETSLVAAELSNSKKLVKLEVGTFSGCTAMVCVDLPPTLTRIESFALENVGRDRGTNQKAHSMKSLMIPPDVNHIGHQAFANCLSLETVTFSSTTHLRKLLNSQVPGRTSVEYKPFVDCKSLHTIDFGQGKGKVSPLLWPLLIHEMLHDSGLFAKSGIAAANRASIAFNFLRPNLEEQQDELEHQRARAKLVVFPLKNARLFSWLGTAFLLQQPLVVPTRSSV
eukprot:CAMPEP_0168844688 /NCGR_PEP_ID=MMETSP0727-20121128/8871_1 /TAXON_ID=265536 /ORGANISM="Amphiprora sp., Strain CCMP467" /LENGTH=396 /DNA_ID=CAMNT_0008898349 /DNA_START=111 /DNA_END=1298 /DNA_ORIENTATION=-